VIRLCVALAASWLLGGCLAAPTPLQISVRNEDSEPAHVHLEMRAGNDTVWNATVIVGAHNDKRETLPLAWGFYTITATKGNLTREVRWWAGPNRQIAMTVNSTSIGCFLFQSDDYSDLEC